MTQRSPLAPANEQPDRPCAEQYSCIDEPGADDELMARADLCLRDQALVHGPADLTDPPEHCGQVGDPVVFPADAQIAEREDSEHGNQRRHTQLAGDGQDHEIEQQDVRSQLVRDDDPGRYQREANGDADAGASGREVQNRSPP